LKSKRRFLLNPNDNEPFVQGHRSVNHCSGRPLILSIAMDTIGTSIDFRFDNERPEIFVQSLGFIYLLQLLYIGLKKIN
jgi:hypothetical protein